MSELGDEAGNKQGRRGWKGGRVHLPKLAEMEMAESKTTVYAFEHFSLHHIVDFMYVAVHTLHICVGPS